MRNKRDEQQDWVVCHRWSVFLEWQCHSGGRIEVGNLGNGSFASLVLITDYSDSDVMFV